MCGNGKVHGSFWNTSEDSWENSKAFKQTHLDTQTPGSWGCLDRCSSGWLALGQRLYGKPPDLPPFSWRSKPLLCTLFKLDNDQAANISFYTTECLNMQALYNYPLAPNKCWNKYWKHICNKKKVQLPATMKANTWEAGADVKESGLFRCQPPGRRGAHVPKPTSVSQCRGFYREGEGNRT